MTYRLRTIRALTRRTINELIRTPTGAVPGILAPTIFMLGLSAVFSAAASLRGFGDVNGFRTFIVPVGLIQGAGFTGAATGVNLARDIEQGWFDRMLVAPITRPTLLAALVVSAALRSLLPGTFLLIVAFALGVHWPGDEASLLGVIAFFVAVSLLLSRALRRKRVTLATAGAGA